MMHVAYNVKLYIRIVKFGLFLKSSLVNRGVTSYFFPPMAWFTWNCNLVIDCDDEQHASLDGTMC